MSHNPRCLVQHLLIIRMEMMVSMIWIPPEVIIIIYSASVLEWAAANNGGGGLGGEEEIKQDDVGERNVFFKEQQGENSIRAYAQHHTHTWKKTLTSRDIVSDMHTHYTQAFPTFNR